MDDLYLSLSKSYCKTLGDIEHMVANSLIFLGTMVVCVALLFGNFFPMYTCTVNLMKTKQM